MNTHGSIACGRASLRRAIAVAAVIAATFGATARAQTQFEDVSVSASAMSGMVSHGYVEYRVGLINHSRTTDHVIELSMPAKSYAQGNTISGLSRTVRLAAGASAVVTMYQPALPLAGNGVAISIDGRTRNGAAEYVIPGVAANSIMGGFSSQIMLTVLISRSIDDDFDTELKMIVSGVGPTTMPMSGPAGIHYSMSGSYQSEVVRAEGPISEWSTNWLTYTRYTAVAIAREDYERGPAAVREALLAYARTGGTLLIVGEVKLPDAARLVGSSGMLKDYHYMFGRVLMSSETNIEIWGKDLQWKVFSENCMATETRWLDVASPFVAMERSTEFQQNTLPLRGMFAMMVLFGVVIGPVNLIVLGKMRRRMWMLWTTPVIAFVACASIMTYNLFSEGWDSRVRVQAVTILDEANHHATSHGWARYYCPLTPGDGLHVNMATMVSPVVERGNYWSMRQSGSAKTIDWTRDQHLQSGWIAARTPTYLMFDVDETRRERLIIKRIDDKTLSVSNGLGAKINSLSLADANGKVFVGGDIAAGAEKTLAANGQTVAVTTLGIAEDGLANSRVEIARRVARDSINYLRPNMYIAQLDGSPFVQSGLSERGMQLTASSVVIGLVKGQEQ